MMFGMLGEVAVEAKLKTQSKLVEMVEADRLAQLLVVMLLTTLVVAVVEETIGLQREYSGLVEKVAQAS
jgi:hypothetical protein|tara:strand:- start:5 stop:211 length:207 start_codon:yes stop_codon:yes gene_type:complete